jgi:hypothetical protein
VQVQSGYPDDHSLRYHFERGGHKDLFRDFHLSPYIDTGEAPSYRRPAEYAAGQAGGISLSRGERTREGDRTAHWSTMDDQILVHEVVNPDLWKSQRGAASSVLGLSGFLNQRPIAQRSVHSRSAAELAQQKRGK